MPFQLQGAWIADVGGDNGHVDIQRTGLRQREGHPRHKVHIHAAGDLLFHVEVIYRAT